MKPGGKLPMNDTEPMANAAADTDPGGPPTEEDARPLGYKEEVSDSDVADLLGRLAPARRPPAVGDTRETNGHDAARFQVAARMPPKATELKAITNPIIIDITQPSAPPNFSRYDSTVPRARPQRSSPNSVKLIVGLAAGVLIATVVMLAWRPWQTAGMTAPASAGPSAPAMASAPPSIAPSPSSSPPPTASASVSASASASVSASASASTPTSVTPEVVSTTTPRRAPPRASAAPPAASSRLPSDIKPTLE